MSIGLHVDSGLMALNSYENRVYRFKSDQDGAPIQFYEILSEAKEIKMLLSDPDLRNKIDDDEETNNNFQSCSSIYFCCL